MDKEVKFRREVYSGDIAKMVSWMNDDRVVEYLNEDQNIDKKLEELLNSQLPIFSQQFNREGSFFLIDHPEEGPIGFLRLVPGSEKAEIVVVIGEPDYWGNGYGYQVVDKGIRYAFYEWRKDKVIAKIHKSNHRSRQIFKKAGFSKEAELYREIRYSLSLETFLHH